MQNIILIISILGIGILAWFTIGPLFVLIVRNSLLYSRKTVIWTAVGIALGNLVHITYSIIAITFVKSISPDSFLVIKFLGVAYLIYLGVKTVLAKTKAEDKNNNLSTNQKVDITKLQAIKIGFVADILSPKASLFFVSIFGSVISAGSPWWVVVILTIMMPLDSFIMASMWSYVFTHNRVKSIYSKYQKPTNIFLGLTLIILAMIIIFYK